MSFREPLFAVLFPEAYAATREQLLRDWTVIAGSLVLMLVVCAWATQPGLA